MDLGSENSGLESTGDNDVVISSENHPFGSNGSYEHHDDGCDLNSNGNGHHRSSLDPVKTKEDAHELKSDKDVAVKSQSESGSVHSNRATSGEYLGTENDPPVSGSPLSPPKVTGTKGKGLKKWRRIRREVTKDSTATIDVTKILKRGSENIFNSIEVAPAEMKQKSEVSVSSTNALVNDTVGGDAFSIDGSNCNYEVAGGSTFSVGADSDNSKDRSSKSSTAASAPRYRHDPSRASSHSREKQKMKHFGGKHSGNASQRLQQGAFQTDTRKKPWVEAVSMDKENSLSSLESDSRSYSSVFMKGRERLMGYDTEHGYDGPAEEQLSVEGPTTVSNKIVRENEEVSQSNAASSWEIRGRSKNDQLSGNGDPLVDCFRILLSAQEALEQEIQKFGELGKELQPMDDSLIKATNLPTYNSVSHEDCKAASFTSQNQAQNIHVLEKQLQEAFGMLKEKESRIAELEVSMNDLKLSNEALEQSVVLRQNKYKEIETEMEGLFKQKMEAEVKYLAVEEKRIIAEKEMDLLLVEQNSRTHVQLQALEERYRSESKTAMSKDKFDEGLSTQTGIWKMRKRAAKFSCYFLVQLILVIFVLQLFVSQFLPKSEMVMPT